MCPGSAYWGHFAPENAEISTNGSIRSESRWQVPVRLGAQCLTQQRPTASGARPSLECFRRTDTSAPPAESPPGTKFFFFFAKASFTQRLPLNGLKSNFAAFSGKGHEAIFEFHASPLPGSSPRRRISLALLQPTPTRHGR